MRCPDAARKFAIAVSIVNLCFSLAAGCNSVGSPIGHPQSSSGQLRQGKAFSDSLKTWWRPERAGWRDWGVKHLQTGDLVFTRGNYYMMLGAINFTDVATTICQADFSHIGIVVIEDSHPMVYDISDDGIQATPFEAYVTRSGYESLAIKRPVDNILDRLPVCVQYIREQKARNTSFDRKFALENDKLYCTELIFEAFNAADIKLCETTQISSLPGRAQVKPATFYLAQRYTGLDESDAIICIGNKNYGIFGSSMLRDVLGTTSVKQPPAED